MRRGGGREDGEGDEGREEMRGRWRRRWAKGMVPLGTTGIL